MKSKKTLEDEYVFWDEKINIFEKELDCVYKDELYSVRDNGAILRHAPKDKKPRNLDNIWTFGRYNAKNGYAEIAGQPIHRIVAMAFHGVPPSNQHVVDHIDTNRRNNRAENLRWVTKLENTLLNPITVKKIILICGSIENFLKDPSKLQLGVFERNFEWMRAVSKEEAATSLERLTIWANSDKSFSGGSLGEWIYARGNNITPKDNKNTNKPNNMSAKNNLSDKNIAIPESLKTNPTKVLKSNPFNFPRPDISIQDTAPVMYKSNSEIFGLLKTLLEDNGSLKAPKLKLYTAGKSIVINDEYVIVCQRTDYNYKGKSRIPKSIIINSNDECFAILMRTKSHRDEEEIALLTDSGYNIFEIDLSWATKGVTEDELKYILTEDTTKKEWLHHKKLIEAKEKLLMVCEDIEYAGNGVMHSYIACPKISDSVQDIDCWYCDYRFIDKFSFEDKEYTCDYCFGKAKIKTYDNLISIKNVAREDDRIIGISYENNGKTYTKNFDAHVQLPGKSIFELWESKSTEKLIIHNIYSNWYVLIEEDPKVNFEATGYVYGILGKSLKELQTGKRRSIYSFNDPCWEIIQ